MLGPSATVSTVKRGVSAREFRPKLSYALTPPNQTTPEARRNAIAAAQSERLKSLPVEALLIYDVQDEAARNAEQRPFSFVPKVDPLSYAFESLQVGSLPRVVYRAVAQQCAASLERWLGRLQAHGGRAVLVGAPSRRSSPSLSLPQAHALCRSQAPTLAFGGVMIPERHQGAGAEDARVCAKTQQGCSFFVSQTIWSLSATKRLLSDLRVRAEQTGVEVPHLLFTFSPCGSAQTLQFLRWLGVAVPDTLRRELLSSKDMLSRSIELASETFAELHAFAGEHGLSVGCNVESVSSRAAEIEASLELVRRVEQQLGARGTPPTVAQTAELRA